MNSRRFKIELVFDILVAIQNKGGKIKPTHLMYKSNLSHKLLSEYLDELKAKDLVREEPTDKSRVVLITDKGLNFLAEMRKVKEFTETFGL